MEGISDRAATPHELEAASIEDARAPEAVLQAISFMDRSAGGPKPDPRTRAYSSGVREALPLLWNAAGRVCGKRLQPVLPDLLNAMEVAGEIEVDHATREELGRISAASIDRFLFQARSEASAEPLCPFGSVLASQNKLNSAAKVSVDSPGTVEATLIRIAEGASAPVRILLLVDVASGWAEYEDLTGSTPADLVAAMESIHLRSPFLVKRIFAGNSRFFSGDFATYCGQRNIELVKSLDRTQQACSEICVGEHLALVQYHNFFDASFRLKSRVIKDAKVVRVHSRPQTPYGRLLISEHIPQPEKDRLQQKFRNMNPATLLRRRKTSGIFRD